MLGSQSWMQQNRWSLIRAERENHPLNLRCSPGYDWFSGLQVHTTCLQSFFQPPIPQVLRAALNHRAYIHVYRTLHLALLNVMRSAQAHIASLSRLLWMAPFLQSINHSTQHDITHKLAEDALNPIVCVPNKDLNHLSTKKNSLDVSLTDNMVLPQAAAWEIL